MAEPCLQPDPTAAAGRKPLSIDTNVLEAAAPSALFPAPVGTHSSHLGL
jgi:hypothetical protein